MEPHLVELLHNNDPPSEAIVHEIMELLAKPSKELSETEAEIQRLEAQLEALKEKRLRLQTSIDAYAPILSPARRLPLDVLCEIFYHCLPTHRNPIMSASEAPVLLTRVCSSWRSIALSFPYIWAKLYIPIAGDFHITYSSKRDYTETFDTPEEEFVRVMETRCEVVEQWLSRSGSCPLSLSISYSCTGHQTINWEEPPYSKDLPDKLFQILLSFCDRWSNIEILMPHNVYQRLQTSISMDKLPMLQTLKAKFDGPEPNHNVQTTDHPSTLLAAPNLKELSLNAFRFTMDVRNRLITPFSRWNQLLTLCIDSSAVHDRDLVDLLIQCPNLVSCTLRPKPLMPGNARAEPQAVAYLPSLKYLTFDDGGSTSEAVQLIFNSINAPLLTSIAYSNSQDYRMYTRSGSPYSCIVPFTSLLGRSTTVRKMALDLPAEVYSDIIECLQIGVPLTHLVVGQTRKARKRNRQLCSIFPSYKVQDEDPQEDFFDLNLLTIGKKSSLLSSGEILLPNLEVLEAHQISTFTDENLLEMISSRIDASTRGEASVLSYIKIQFDRPKQMDIMGELFGRAKAAGISMKLELQYSLTAKPGPASGRLSASFGLEDDDDLDSDLEPPTRLAT
ncbi:hypothetical protein BDZ97DRAFT_1827250 [Flammula alnicola]|nr:hypothetical protein BDZ97DRAFT_1827250 [Flammula alnicola]